MPRRRAAASVDDVVAGRRHGDEVELRQRRQSFLAQRRLVGENDLRPAAARTISLLGRAIVDGQLAQGRHRVPGVIARVERVAVEHDDSHGRLRVRQVIYRRGLETPTPPHPRAAAGRNRTDSMQNAKCRMQNAKHGRLPESLLLRSYTFSSSKFFRMLARKC